MSDKTTNPVKKAFEKFYATRGRSSLKTLAEKAFRAGVDYERNQALMEYLRGSNQLTEIDLKELREIEDER